MKTKVCIKCGIKKDITDFYTSKRNKTGYMNTCKVCRRLYIDEHIEQKRQYERDHYQERKLKRKEYFRTYNKSPKYRAYRESIKEQQKEYSKQYRQTEKGKSVAKKTYEKNKDKYKYPEQRRKHEKERYRNDLNYNIIKKLRTRFYKAVHRDSKKSSILKLIGCSIEELKKHIESLFTEGMNWDLYYQGKIHIDHIKPIESFDMTDLEQQKECFQWTNLQPLWGEENLSKGSTYNGIRHYHKKS